MSRYTVQQTTWGYDILYTYRSQPGHKPGQDMVSISAELS